MTAPPPLQLEHSVRVSALEPERTWKLRGDTLWICTEGQVELPIPLSEVCELRLAFEPSRFQLNRFRCYLRNAFGPCATIQNEHFTGFASFHDRTDTYLELVRSLISRIAVINPACRFKAGTSAFNWWLQAVILSTGLMLLGAVLFFLAPAIGWLVVVKLALMAVLIPVVISWFSRNRPRTFSPDAIPTKLIPKTRTS